MRRRPSRSNAALDPLARVLLGAAHVLQHHLPVALFLAGALSTLGPDLLRDTETLVMRGVYFFDLKFVGMFDRAMVAMQTRPAADPAERRPEVSIVSLTPASFSNYLLRTSPVPRARLACLIYALAQSLPAPASDRDRPVVGIDIDITPPESASPGAERWHPTDDETGCRAAYGDEGSAEPLVAEVVRWAVAALAKTHCVVAIAYPRPADTDVGARDAFMQAVERTEGPGECGGVRFASPDLVQIPHEYVAEYATGRMRYESVPAKIREELGPFGYAALPEQACSLGRVMGARLRRLRGYTDAVPCLAPSWEDAVRPIKPSAYETRRIHFAPARSAIGYSRVVPGKATFKGDLLADAKRAFGAVLQPSDLYVLAADTGTGADEFMVPVIEAPVPGAWVHAAVALTEFDTRKGHGDAGGHGPVEYLAHVGTDLVCALLFAWTTAAATHFARSVRNEVGRQILVATAPAVVLAVFVALVLLVDAAAFAHGRWEPHLLVLVGMALHTYVDLASRTDSPAHSTGHREADPVRRSVQLLWAAALWVFIVLGVLPEWHANPWLTVAVALACGSVHLAVALRWHLVPLPWRLHATHRVHPSHGV